jgi:small subunit ribosomal protein S6
LSAEYELILMLDPEVPDERREEIAGNAKQRIETAGSLRHSDTWGTRKLAFEIKQRNEADYRFYRFEAEPPLLGDLDHTLKITDGILRFRLFKVDPRAPLIEPPPGIQLGTPDRSERRGKRDDRGSRRDDRPAREEAPAAESTPSAPEAPVAPETPVEPAEPTPEAPEPGPSEPPAEEPAPESPPAAEAEPAER